MKHQEIREKFLRFFERNGHKIVPSSSLIPDDPSVLLTTAGMQQFKKYYTGEADPIKDFGTKNTASIQKSFRTSDIDEVGDESHLTFFEMLGNFSFGGYFKEETIRYAYDFIVKEMGLKISYVTVFSTKGGSASGGEGSIDVPEDIESERIWKSVDPSIEVRKEGIDDVFWGPTGSQGPCGPTTEVYIKNGAGQDIEVWNCVFNEYFFLGSREELLAGSSGKKLEKLKTPGVDTGMGLERLAMISQKTKTIFETDLFSSIIGNIIISRREYDTARIRRIIADHVRAAAFLLADGVRPSNKEAGYVLRRLMRRAMVYGSDINTLLDVIIREYGSFYHELRREEKEIYAVFDEEYSKFNRTLRLGLKELEKLENIDAASAFKLYESYGVPYEVVKEYGGGEKAKKLTRAAFDEEFKRHQEISRAGSEAKFGGHGLYLKTGEVTIRDESEIEKVTRLHTATHLMHAALRAVLGPDVRQDGSDITVERTRFDFRFPRKVTPEELAKIEEWVNAAIQKDLSVEWKETDYENALKDGALGFFREKYPPRVKVYTVFDQKSGEVLSKEFCGGPHVEHTGVIGRFRITKEESSSAGVRRIRAVIEPREMPLCGDSPRANISRGE